MNKRGSGIRTLYDFSSDEQNIRHLEVRENFANTVNQAVETALRSHPVSKFVRDSFCTGLFMQPAISDKRCFCPDRDGEGNLLQTSLLKGRNDSYIEWSLPGHNLSLPKKHGCGFSVSDTTDFKYVACTGNKEHYAKAKANHCWSLGCPNCSNDTALRNGARIEARIAAYPNLSERRGLEAAELKHWVISPPQTEAKLNVLTVKGYTALWKEAIGIMKKYGMEAGYGVFHPWRLQKAKDYRPGQYDPVDNWFWAPGPHFHILGYGYIDTDSFRKDIGYCNGKNIGQDLTEDRDRKGTGSETETETLSETEIGTETETETLSETEIGTETESETGIENGQCRGDREEKEKEKEKELEDKVNRERWLLKQVHPGQKIRSIRQTAGYLLTHAGIGMAEQPFPTVSAYRKGKPKPEALAYAETRRNGRDRDITEYLRNLDGPARSIPLNRRDEMHRLSADLSGAIFGFDTEDQFGTDAFAEFEHSAENDTLSEATLQLFCPDRPYNILSYERDAGPKFRFVSCQNEYFGPDYTLSAYHYGPEDNNVSSKGDLRRLGRRSGYGPETPDSYIILRHEDPEYCGYGRPSFGECDSDDGPEHIRWLDWTMKQYTKTFQVSKLFGMLDSRHIRVRDTIVDVVQRECQECGSPLGEYCGCMDNYEPAVFKRRTNVFVRTEDSDFVEELWEELKERLVLEGKTKNDFYALLPQASTAFSCGLEPKPTSAHSSKTPEPVRVPAPERIAFDPGKGMRSMFDKNL